MENPVARRYAGKHHGSPQSRAERAARREKVAALYAKGIHSHRELGKIVGCSRTAIHRDLQWLRAEWEAKAKLSYNQAIEEMLHRLDVKERELWAWYARTQQSAERVVTADGGDGQKKTLVETRGRCGDPRVFALLGQIEAQRMKIRGIPKTASLDEDAKRARLTLAMIPLKLLQQLNSEIDAAQMPQLGHNEIEANFVDDKTDKAVDRPTAEDVSSGSGQGDKDTGVGADTDSGEAATGDGEEEVCGDGACQDDSEPGPDGGDTGQGDGEEAACGCETED